VRGFLNIREVSAVKRENWKVEAPAIVVDHQDTVLDMHKKGELERDFIIVLRFQGPRANGMPELHKLTPIMGALQDKGFKVGLVTDGRMSGASGKVPAAIHMHPEAMLGGQLAKVRTGDMISLDPASGSVNVISDEDWESRAPAAYPPQPQLSALGMNMFGPMRAVCTDSEMGASFLGDLAIGGEI